MALSRTNDSRQARTSHERLGIGKKRGRSASVPENYVLVRAKFASTDEVCERSKGAAGVDGVQQNPFQFCHEPYRVAFEIPDHPIAVADILSFQNDLG